MELIIVPAHELKLRDILGEGQEIWFIASVPEQGTITIYWWNGNGSLMTARQDLAHRMVFGKDDPVKIIRRNESHYKDTWVSIRDQQTENKKDILIDRRLT